MSVRLMTKGWALKLEPMTKFILIALADFANDEGECWPSVETVASKTGTSRRTVQRAIGDLEKAGHLSRSQILGKGCRYRVHPRHSNAPSNSDPRHSDAPPRHSDTPTRATVTQDPRHSDAQTINEPSLEPLKEPSLKPLASKSVISAVSVNANYTPERMADAWNEVAKIAGLPTVRGLEGKRKANLKKAMASRSLNDWKEVFTAIAESDFLLGRKGGWRASFDWLIKPENFQKVLEGAYKNSRSLRDDKRDGFQQALDRELGLDGSPHTSRSWNRDISEIDAHPTLVDFEIPF